MGEEAKTFVEPSGHLERLGERAPQLGLLLGGRIFGFEQRHRPVSLAAFDRRENGRQTLRNVAAGARCGCDHYSGELH